MDNKEYELLIQDALTQIRQLKTELRIARESYYQSVAVIGMGCRLPGSNGIINGSLWNFLNQGQCSISDIPKGRWSQPYYNPDRTLKGYCYTNKGSFFPDIKEFDPTFFGISPREALYMDPQHRFMLEVVYETLENAGIPPKDLKNQEVGVFMAQSSDDYNQLTNNLNSKEHLDYYSGTGTSRSMLAGRISYVLGIHGPSIQVDTSCSSSLVAIHLAAQSLRAGECEVAIVGGVQLNLSPMSGILRSQTQALSPDGECRTFDDDANGFVLGKGIGALVLSTEAYANSHNRNVQAFICGTAINHDGASAGLTAPSESAQIKVIQSALENGGIDPGDVDFIETHGTGTVLGDPIEIGALSATYGRNRESPIWLGSVKSNIGHLEAAAGIISTIKSILALKNRTIPPHLYSKNLNKHIEWQSLPFKIPDKPINWQKDDGPRLAAVSSFGMSGTNAHILLREAHVDGSDQNQEGVFLFCLSAKTETSLYSLIASYVDFLEHNSPSIQALCYTSCACRSHYKHRVCAIVRDIGEVKVFLKSFQEKKSFKSVCEKFSKSTEAIDHSVALKASTTQGRMLSDMQKYNITFTQEFIDELFSRDPLSLKSKINDKIGEVHPMEVLKIIAEAYLSGEEINWKSLYQNVQTKPITLPNYVFNRKSIWPDNVVT